MLAYVPRRSSGVVLAAFAVALVGCEPATSPDRSFDPAQITVTANVSSTSIATMVVKVTGPEIPTPLVFNLEIEEGIASGTLLVPAGSDRKIEVDAFNSEQLKTHHGEKTITSVKPGPNNALVSIVLLPIAGEQPVTANFGKYVVKVTPTEATLTIGGPAKQLAVEITDNSPAANKVDPLPGEVKWATTNPAALSVSADGLVTPIAVGSGQVVATFKGVAATSSITVVQP